MSDVYQVRIDPAAVDALEETVRYIEEQSGPGRAEAWLEAALSAVAALETSPRAFSVACIRRGRAIRSKVVLSHRVFYFIDEPSRLVYVIDVVHTARETRLALYRDRLD